MDRAYQSNVSTEPPQAPAPGVFGFVQSDVPLSSSSEPTELDAYFFHYVTESFRTVVVGAGMEPDASNFGQLAAAVKFLADSAPA